MKTRDNIKSMTALITGGAGFIGSNLSAHLLRQGWKVIIFDNLSRQGSQENLAWIARNSKTPKLKILISDVRDYQELKKALERTDVIFHLAAQVAVTTSIENPREDFEANALGTFNVLEAARKSGHNPVIIFSSTNKVYGSLANVAVKEHKERYDFADYKDGISEDFPLDFHTPYGCSNGAADQYTRDYFRIYALPTVVFRQSCIYGPRQMGIEDQGWMAHFVISAALERRITIYGNGKQVRDVLYVDDLIEAFLKAVDRADEVKGEIFNIGGGFENSLSLLEFIEFLQKRLGKRIDPVFKDSRPGDQKVFISDNRKLKEKLGWRPKVSYQEGVDKLIFWIKENEDLFRGSFVQS